LKVDIRLNSGNSIPSVGRKVSDVKTENTSRVSEIEGLNQMNEHMMALNEELKAETKSLK
jgi:hypothetical protein